MHELSIVMSIVEIAEEEAAKADVKRFDTIVLEIGTLSGVVMEALDFAWSSAVSNTVLDGAQKEIHSIAAVAKCNDCNCEFDVQTLYEACPECGSYYTHLIKGNELKIKSLIVEHSL